MDDRKLYRSRDDRMLAGICGGIAEYFEMDPTVVRLLAVVLAVVGNIAVGIAYIVMWIVVPEQPFAGTAPTPAAAPPAAAPPAAAPPAAAPPADAPPADAPPASLPPAGPLPAPQEPTVAARGVRSGLIWLGILLIVLGASILIDRIYPDLNLWGFWPATLVGLFFVAAGIRTMVTKEDEN